MTELRTADTSVVIPALTGWHTMHQVALAAVDGIERLPAHVMVESVSVLTRMPRGMAVSPATAVDVLRAAFPGDPWILPAIAVRAFLHALGDADIGGGRVYDALVAATAAEAGAVLLTLDRRAEPTYRAVGANVRTLDRL